MNQIPIMEMSREHLEEALLWNSGGNGWGGNVGVFLAWALDEPRYPRGKDDLKSVVAIGTPKEEWTEDELKQLLDFSREHTAEYDEMFRWRRGCNLITIRKVRYADGKVRYNGSRASWTIGGPAWGDTLEEVFKRFRR